MKKEVSLERANRIINSGQVILVSSAYEDKSGIVTLAWSMPLSHKPPLMAISIARKRFTYGLIKSSGEFVVNVPSADLLDAVMYCGTHSGRDVDKFKEAGLTAEKAVQLKSAPLVRECVGHLECRLDYEREAGDHILLIGSIVRASAEEKLFDEKWNVDKVRLLYHLGDRFFTTSEKEIVV